MSLRCWVPVHKKRCMISRPHLDFEVLFFPGFSKCNLLGLLGGKRREDMAAAPLRSVLTFFYFGFYFAGCSSSFGRLLHDVIPVRHDEVVALRVPWTWDDGELVSSEVLNAKKWKPPAALSTRAPRVWGR